MSADVIDAMFDAGLNYLANNITAIVAMTVEPSTYADTQNATYKLAQGTLTSADFLVTVGESGYRRRIDFYGKALSGTSALAFEPSTTAPMWWAFVNTAGSLLLDKVPSLNYNPIVVGAPIVASARQGLCQYGAPVVSLVI